MGHFAGEVDVRLFSKQHGSPRSRADRDGSYVRGRRLGLLCFWLCVAYLNCRIIIVG